MKVNTFKPFLGGICLATMLVVGRSAKADFLYFTQITQNGNQSVAAQLSVDVTASGAGVLFKFFNTGSIASSITDIYFDDGTLLALSSITPGGSGVVFDDPANPGNLPGGNTVNPGFNTTAGFSADSSAPAAPNGVNPGEWVSIFFTLQGVQTFADTIAALTNGALRIGLHVQAIGGLGSESFVNNTPDGDTPKLPDGGSTIALLGLALVGADMLRRKLIKS